MITQKTKITIKKQDILRINIGIVYLWFGVLKFFPELSPAEDLAKNTLSHLTFGLGSDDTIPYLILAIWESLIGLLLIVNMYPRFVICIAIIHMLGTFMPLLLSSNVVFNKPFMSLTLVGQYIIKNLIIVSALIMIFPKRKRKMIESIDHTSISKGMYSSFFNAFIQVFKSKGVKQKVMLWLMFLMCFQSCKDESAIQLNVLNDGTHFHNTVKQLTNSIVHDIFSPPVASRVYVYPNIAAYECLAAGNKDLQTLSGQLNGLTTLPSPEKEKLYNFEIASLKAFLTVSKTLIFSVETLDEYETKLFHQIEKENISKAVLENSIHYGVLVAGHILKWADQDNYKQTRTFPSYSISDKSSSWQPTPPDYMEGIEPHWNKIRPFIIDSATQFIPVRPTTFDISKGSDFYKEVMEVYTTGKNLNREEEEIAKFWDCNPYVSHHKGHGMFAAKKITPGGHWMGITAIAAKQRQLSFKSTVEAYTRTSIALADAFISCWDEKYRSNLIRPETLINKYIDEDWTPLLQTPPFPEYTSGHSVVSGAASLVLTDLFGDNFKFTDTTEVEYGLPERQFSSFKMAADEAAISRLYGGIHYMPAIRNGIDQGRKVGYHVIKNLITKIR